MKTVFFLVSLALGMLIGVVSYILGGVLLMATGLSFSVVIFGSLMVMAAQVRQVLNKDDADEAFALPA